MKTWKLLRGRILLLFWVEPVPGWDPEALWWPQVMQEWVVYAPPQKVVTSV